MNDSNYCEMNDEVDDKIYKEIRKMKEEIFYGT
jgi:hypothetical protein